MPELGPHLTLACPLCKQPVRVEITVVGHSSSASHVLAELDKSEADRHVAECAGRVPVAPPLTPNVPAVPTPELTRQDLVGRVHHFLRLAAFITPGDRWCTGCKTPAGKCLQRLERRGKACCGMCAEGSTHPVPGAQVDCQVWAAEHGPKD